MSFLTGPFSYAFFGRALAAGLLVGVLCGTLGVFVVLRRMAYVGQGLGYGLLGGVALAALAGVNVYAGAVVATIVGGVAIEWVRRVRGLSADVAIAIVSTTLFSLGAMILSADRTLKVNLEDLLFGNVLGVDGTDIAIVAAISAGAGLVLFLFYKPLVFATFDPLVARLQGVKVDQLDLVYSLLVGAVVIVSLRIVGVLLITAALVLPASIARLLCRSLTSMLVLAALIGASTSVAGLYWSYHADVASGPAVVLVGAALFTVVALGNRLAGARRVREIRRQVSGGLSLAGHASQD
jgi:ABC-type Mn2+/Zn2+ transport system permease subunit